jgi:hypothetical protein
MRPATPLLLWILAASAGLAPAAVAAETSPSPPVASADERLAALEKRLALLDRKLGLLAAPDERALADVSAVFADPARLLAEARHAIEQQRDLARAYRLLGALHALHPGSAPERDAFLLAARLHSRLYFLNRHAGPDSIWGQAEPLFMFQWLATLAAREPSATPQKEAEALLLGMPVSFFQQFATYAEKSPALARWSFQFTKDNGLVESLEVTAKK